MDRKRETVLLLWAGAGSVKAAKRAIDAGNCVEISLPQGVHHALLARLDHGDVLDVQNGAEILPLVASVAGLEDLGKLAPAVRHARYRVRVTSPDPVIVLTPSDAPRKAA
jgi:hypothetical protein